jgi:5-methylcytosine-specific restriction protein A
MPNEFPCYIRELGSGFIHVHHTTPVSQLTTGYIIDPLTDLVPVCPNCHAMLHKENPHLIVRRLKEMMESLESTKIE